VKFFFLLRIVGDGQVKVDLIIQANVDNDCINSFG
jgi:hypothetical protein